MAAASAPLIKIKDNMAKIRAEVPVLQTLDTKLSKKRSSDEVIDRYFTCTACDKFIDSQILLCHHDHRYHAKCWETSPSCKKCGNKKAAKVTAKPTEEFRDSFKMKCLNQGCEVITVGYKAMSEHREKCEHFKCRNKNCTSFDKKVGSSHECKSIISCPLSTHEYFKCPSRINSTDLQTHLVNEHKFPVIEVKIGETHQGCKLDEATKVVRIFKIDDEYVIMWFRIPSEGILKINITHYPSNPVTVRKFTATLIKNKTIGIVATYPLSVNQSVVPIPILPIWFEDNDLILNVKFE